MENLLVIFWCSSGVISTTVTLFKEEKKEFLGHGLAKLDPKTLGHD